MSFEAVSAAEINIEGIPGFAQYVASNTNHQDGGVQAVTDVGQSVLQLQDVGGSNTFIQVSEGNFAPLVQFGDQSQGMYITDSSGIPQSIQILDGSVPIIQGPDGTSIIQLAAPSQFVSGAGMEGLTQVVQFAGGQIALIEHQENIDPQNVQFVLEQVPVQQTATDAGDGEMQQQQQQLMSTAAPMPAMRDQEDLKPPIGKGPYTCDICEKKCEKWNQYVRHIKTHDDDKPFRCFHCPATFNIADNLKLHLAIHVEDGAKPSCPDCGKDFSRIASLKAHIMLHEKEESLMCIECGDEFGTQSHLDRHMLEHKEEREGTRVFSCKQCSAQFFSRGELKEHTKQHFKIRSSLSHRTYKKEVDRTSFSNKCSHCNKTFQKPSQLLRHVRIHTGDRPFKCHVCLKAFNQRGALQLHIIGRHTDRKPHRCQFCGTGFVQKGNLRAHIQRVHTLTEKNEEEQAVYTCTECSCMFKKLGSLNAHISRVHTQLDDEAAKLLTKRKKYIYDEEPNGTDDVIQQLLELSEAGEKSIKPEATSTEGGQNDDQAGEDILQQALENSGVQNTDKGQDSATSGQDLKSGPGGTLSLMNLRDTATGLIKKHYVRKLGNVIWHQCAFCHKEFKKPSDLIRHSRIHSHEKPYKCTQCFRAFAVKSTLNSHIRTHSGIKSFGCTVCDKNFATQGSLKVHLRLHTGIKPYKCGECSKTFRTQAHLRAHIASHSKNSGERGPVRMKSDSALKRLGKEMPDIPLQEPILITDTGLIQQPPRSSMFNQYLGESSSVDRPYKCSYCQRGFKKSSHLKQHIRSHTGEKPYKCMLCSRSFVSNGVLKAHIRIHSGQKTFKCLLCDNLFSTNGSLKRHMSTHSDVRPFMCPYCQRQFKTNVNCKKHMRTHRHELAMQHMTGPTQIQSIEQTVQNHETVITNNEQAQYVEEEAVDNELSLVQHDPNTSMASADLGQSTVLGQTGLQDLGLTSTSLDQQILGQQMFGGQAQTFTQSLLGTGPVTLNTSHSQYNLQNPVEVTFSQSVEESMETDPGQATMGETMDGTDQDNAVDAGQMISSDMPSTSMQNILPTGDLADEEDDENNVDDIPTDEEVEDEEDNEPVDEGGEQTEDSPSLRPHQCGYCEKAYKKSSHLKQHIRSHTGEKPYKCSQCEKTFVSMGVLRQHLRTHTGVKEYKCSVCQALFTTNGSLTRHMNVHMTLRAKPYKCPFCLEAFRTAHLCKKHMEKHTNGEDEEEETIVAGTVEEVLPPLPKEPLLSGPRRIQKSRANLFKRANVADVLNNANLSEKVLAESNTERERVSELKELQVIKGEKFAHQCQHCPKSFKKPSDLARHIRIHTGEKPYSCGICGRPFTVKSTLDSHMKTHGSNEKSIACHVCNSMFSTKGSLKVHMRLHTGAKPFKCPHCSQRFRTSGHRKSHVLQHYKPGTSLRRKRQNIQPVSEIMNTEQPTEPIDFLNQVPAAQTDQQAQGQVLQQGQMQMGQVVNIDPSMLQGNMMPLSLTIDNFGNITDGSMGNQMIQGLEGVQIQLPGGNLAQGIQITGLDPNSVGQAIQIDANLLQQIQAGLNISFNPGQLQVADPNMVQSLANLQVQPMNIQDGVNPNLVIQPLGAMGVDQGGVQMPPGSHIGMVSDMGQGGNFVMTTSGMVVEQQQSMIHQSSVMSVGGDQMGGQSVQAAGPTHMDHVVGGAPGGMDLQGSLQTFRQDMEGDGGSMSQLDPNMSSDHLGDNMAGLSNAMIGGNHGEVESDSEVVAEVLDDAQDDSHEDDDVVPETVGDDIIDEHLHDEGMVDQLMKPHIGEQMVVQNFGRAIYQCNTCGHQFNDVKKLKQHQKVHMRKSRMNRNEMPQTNTIETLGVSDNPNVVHLSGDVVMSNPNIVSLPEATVTTLSEHSTPSRAAAKPGKASGSARKSGGPHDCPFCGKTFQKPSQMERHRRIHTGERPFRCDLCSKAFNQKNALQMHLKKHKGEKSHQCPYCNTAFVQKGNLNTHIKRSHYLEMVRAMQKGGIGDGDIEIHLESVGGGGDMAQGGDDGEGEMGEGLESDQGAGDGAEVVNKDINLGHVDELFNN
ncbi:zinc finger protein 236-like [Mya arenaria]|uniref:zinc finger protein 236-like n=1 Tax=Mya arenaria TaxID=6604 RepID=UPI0022E95B43|nr:zinc finger protein 236-like [Mya arenaria]